MRIFLPQEDPEVKYVNQVFLLLADALHEPQQ